MLGDEEFVARFAARSLQQPRMRKREADFLHWFQESAHEAAPCKGATERYQTWDLATSTRGTDAAPRGSFSKLSFQRRKTIATTMDSKRETVSLIGSDKVEGTAVCGADDRKIGSVQRVMIDKVSGNVAYAVITFGGFLGMGELLSNAPANLKYDTNLGGYRVGGTQ